MELLDKKMDAKNLNDFLENYLIAVINGDVPDITGLGKDIQRYINDNLKKDHTGFFKSWADMGEDFCHKSYSYWLFREDIQNYQIKNQISSVYDAVISWDDSNLIYPQISDQLMIIEGDIEQVTIVKDLVIDWFISFAKEYIDFKNYILNQSSVYSDFVFRSTNLSKIKEIALDYEFAVLSPYPLVTPVGDIKNSKFTCYWWEKEFNLLLYRRTDKFQESIQELDCLVFSLVKTGETSNSLL